MNQENLKIEAVKQNLILELTEISKGKFSFVIAAGAPYDEVEDTVFDVLSVGVIIEKALADGLQVTDLLAALELQPIIKELINDFKLFVEQFKKLTPMDAINSVISARNRILQSGKKLGPVTNFVSKELYSNAKSYEFAVNTFEAGKAQFELYKALFSGGAIFPDEMEG